MESNNPILKQEYFAQARGATETMTVQGTVNKTFGLFFILVLAASWVWSKIYTPGFVSGDELAAKAMAQSVASVQPYIVGGFFVGLALGFVTIFKRDWARYTTPLYAACQGFVLGGISVVFEMNYPGLVMQAVAGTFGTMFCMLMLYKSRIIAVNNKFVMGLTAATGAIALVYLADIILGFWGIRLNFIYQSTPIGIGFSLLVIAIAAFNLILDFYRIEEGERLGADKDMEWYAAFGLMVTLIWLYLEILRLLAKMRDRR